METTNCWRSSSSHLSPGYDDYLSNSWQISKICPQDESKNISLEKLLNHQYGESRTTALHLAAKLNHKNILLTLLQHGADPSVRDKLKKVPFMMAESKDTRNTFRFVWNPRKLEPLG